MLVKVKTKTLIYYQSSGSTAYWLKQNTFNMLSYPLFKIFLRLVGLNKYLNIAYMLLKIN